MRDDQVVALDKLEAGLKRGQEGYPDLSRQLQADKAAVLSTLVKVMFGSQRSGISKISFVTVQD
jgi:biopolymer transport protein TolR